MYPKTNREIAAEAVKEDLEDEDGNTIGITVCGVEIASSHFPIPALRRCIEQMLDDRDAELGRRVEHGWVVQR